MHNLLLTFLVASLGVSTIATYLQPAACPGYSLNTWTAGANYTILDARLDHAGQNGTLSFIIGRSLSQQECQMLPENATTDLSITRSGRSSERHVESPVRCAAPEARQRHHRVRIPVTVDLGPVVAFSDIGVRMETTVGDQGEVSCLVANVTAAPTALTKLLLRWILFGIYMFVLFVSAMRTVYPIAPALDQAARLDPGILPDAGECLLHLQFAFLTGSMTLSYPGFFQPIISHLNIFSLFNPGPLAHSHAYTSIADGIYTMNGTYGGTLGLELMHQIVGVPQTADTWCNMIIAVFIVAFAIAVVLEIQMTWTERRQTSTIGTYGGFNHRFTTILKAVFSYFTLPICALTFYQTNYTTILPVHHMAFALGTIVLVLLAFIWLFRQSTPDSMGEFVVGRPKETQQHKRSKVSTSNERAFVVAHFALIFIRGAVIGSLQHFPGTQLIMLLLCEFGLLLAILLFRIDQLCTIRLVSTVFRIVALALLYCFLPGLTDGRTKDILGWSILTLHATALGLLFCMPAMYHLVTMVWYWTKRTGPKAYGLRQLNRRSRRTSDWVSNSETNSLEDHDMSSVEQLEDNSDKPPVGGSRLLLPGTGFFRQPSRSSFYPNMRVLDYGQLSSGDASDSHAIEMPSSPGQHAAIPLQSLEKINMADSGLDSNASSPNANSLESLGPRWNDFTFRESDLVYGSPFRSQESNQVLEANNHVGMLGRLQRSSILRTLWPWNKGDGGRVEEAHAGFQVVRASRHPL